MILAVVDDTYKFDQFLSEWVNLELWTESQLYNSLSALRGNNAWIAADLRCLPLWEIYGH